MGQLLFFTSATHSIGCAVVKCASFRSAYIAVLLCCSLIYSNQTLADDRSTEFGSAIDFTMYRLASQHNDPSAQYLVGRNYLTGKSVRKDVLESIQWFERAASQGHTKAQYQLGMIYLYGKGISKDYKTAFGYLSKAAEKKHLAAQYELGNYYTTTTFGKTQYDKAVFWYRKAAKRNHRKAAFELGKLLYEDHDSEKQKGEAIRLIQLAEASAVKGASKYLANIKRNNQFNSSSITGKHNQGDSNNEKSLDSQYRLAISYLSGDSARNNADTAARILSKIAESNHDKAQYQLSKLYRDGIGVLKNSQLALTWLKQAATNGNEDARRELQQVKSTPDTDISTDKNDDKHYRLGMNFLVGEGVEKDYELAAMWLLRSANNNNSEAKFQLGLMYKNGMGMTADKDMAKRWFKSAASDGLAKADLELKKLNSRTRLISKANKQLTDKPFAKEPLKKSPLQAVKIQTTTNNESIKLATISTPLMRNANAGDSEAQYKLGLQYLTGDTKPEDTSRAIDWIMQSADQGFVDAQLKLATLYYDGDLIQKNRTKAAKWYGLAANNGHSEAQFTLAEMYKKGQGVDRNNSMAIKWYRKAANQGHKKARKKLGGCRIC